MKSPYKIAQEIGVSPQAVYKKLTTEFKNEYANHIITDKSGKLQLDEAAEQELKKLFEKVKQPLNNLVQEQLYNQLSNEVEYLRRRNEALEQALSEEREHSRQQEVRIAEMAQAAHLIAVQATQKRGLLGLLRRNPKHQEGAGE